MGILRTSFQLLPSLGKSSGTSTQRVKFSFQSHRIENFVPGGCPSRAHYRNVLNLLKQTSKNLTLPIKKHCITHPKKKAGKIPHLIGHFDAGLYQATLFRAAFSDLNLTGQASGVNSPCGGLIKSFWKK